MCSHRHNSDRELDWFNQQHVEQAEDSSRAAWTITSIFHCRVHSHALMGNHKDSSCGEGIR